MKKLTIFLISVCSLVSYGTTESKIINETPIYGEVEKGGIADPIECRVENASLMPVTQVSESTPPRLNAYWLVFTNNTGDTPSEVIFEVTFNPSSPLIVQRQVFVPGSCTGIRTPFGVPFWGGNPIRGRATLTVTAEGIGECSYEFEVTG